jgi:hypothetical protein
VSDAQRPEPQAGEDMDDRVPTDVDGNPIPSAETLAAQALPAVYSRSPRMVRVIATSAAIGAVLGGLVGLLLPSGFLSGRGAAAAVMAFAGALMGALISGAVVASGEYREARHVAQRKAAAIDEWLAAHPEPAPQRGPADPPHDSSGSKSTAT